MNAKENGRARRRLFLFRINLLLVLFGGLALSGWQIREADRVLRSDLLRQTTLLSWALRADLVDSLDGSPADLGNPVYERIKDQLLEARTLYPACRFLYVLRRGEDGHIRFLADSEPPSSGNYSPPGQIYGEATPALHSLFASARPFTEGPEKDRWGTWISPLVPLFHPLDDRLVAVLGMDMDAARWRSELLRAAYPPAFIALGLLAALAFGYALVYRHATPPQELWWRSPALHLTVIMGLLVTLLAAHLLHRSETARRRDAFHRAGTLQASLMQQALFRIGDNYLEGLARFFTASSFVDRDEFRSYIGYLLNRPYAQAWGWAPAVAATNQVPFEAAYREWNNGGFRIWELPGGSPGDPLYPICYLEPAANPREVQGFDLASDPRSRQALEQAQRTRLTVASEPMDLSPYPHLGRVVLAFRPVFSGDDPDRLSGFAFVILRMDVLLFRALSRESTRSDAISLVDLYAWRGNGPGLHLTSNHEGAPPAHVAEKDVLVAPAFAFGRTYALLSRPGPALLEQYPAVAFPRAVGTGLLLTALAAALVSTIGHRRMALERLVNERTAALRESESSYHGLFNAIRQAIYIQSEDGRFLDVNDGAVAMYGHPREAFIGRTPEFLGAPGRNNMPLIQTAFERALRGEPQRFEFWGLRANGEPFPKEVWLYRSLYFGKTVVVAIATDISERTQAEEEKARLQDQLEQARKLESIGRLAGGVAHDFNNMLQAIMGNAGLALEEIAPAHPVREYLEEIQKSAQRSADLTRQLLAFASRQPVSPRVIDLNNTIAGMLKMLRRLIGEEIQLVWVPGPETWPVKMDPSQVDQILANLLVNARDAIRGAGTVTIETANLHRDDRCRQLFSTCAPGDYVQLTVRDSGCGMDEETRAHLFEPFYTTKPVGRGVGLGLATIFGIVKQNNGFIDVKSEPGQGTVFTLGLPRTELPVEPAAAPPASAKLQGGSETLLLVEDEGSVLRFGKEALKRLGYTVIAAGRPEQALELARGLGGHFDLLVTDLVLPGLNGCELAARLRELKPGLKCLYMSGYTADIIASHGILDEDVNFIQKPFRLDELAAKIRSVLNA